MLALVSGNPGFAFKLYQSLRQEADGNLFFSPYSISQALAMTYAGARGRTARQIADTLSFTLPQPALHEAFSTLNADLVRRGHAENDPEIFQTPQERRIPNGLQEASNQTNNDQFTQGNAEDSPAFLWTTRTLRIASMFLSKLGRTLRIANSLWGEQTLPFNSAYIGQIRQYYGVGVKLADFTSAADDVRQQINGWVADQTEDRIQNMVPEGAINAAMRLVLTSAVYFKDLWLLPFEPEATQDGNFFLLDSSTVTVPFMAQREDFNYMRGDNYQAVEFPYLAGNAMLVILPDEGQFQAFEAALNAETFKKVVGRLHSRNLTVYLPKFEVDYATSLSKTLAVMGMPDAFNRDRADFSGAVEGTPPAPLFISDVLHKAFITIDEYGTEAAAALVSGLEIAAMAEKPREVRIDHPFIFAIRDWITGTVLFLGRVINPSA
jgi:serpin B